MFRGIWQKHFLPVEPNDKLSCFSRVRLCDPMDCSPPGSSVHGILQATILVWAAAPSSRASSLTQESNQCFLRLQHWRVGSLPLAPPGKPMLIKTRGLFSSCKNYTVWYWSLVELLSGFPGGASGKELACHCRRCKRHRFDPRVKTIPWRRALQPTPIFLPGESHGQRSLVGYSPWGRKESDTTEAN